MARGGSRTPTNPAAVSGPGALSQRTDGGASQPIRLAPGGPYGQRQALEQTQQAAPLAAGTGSGAPSPSAPPPTPGLEEGFGGGGVFGPTQRPQEPANTGLTPQGGMLDEDPDMLVRYLYSLYPHPDILRLLDPNRSP